jgi:hypothetical protein
MLDTIGAAQADAVVFTPDWLNNDAQAEQTICTALAQGWSRAQIVDAAEHANNYNLTGTSVVQAAEHADALIDAARYKCCPTLNVS